MRVEIQTPSAEHRAAELAHLAVLRAYRITAIGTMQDCILRTLVASRIAGILCLNNLAAFQHQCLASFRTQARTQR